MGVDALSSCPLRNDGDVHSPASIWLLLGVFDDDEIGDDGAVFVPVIPLPINDGVIK